MSQEQSNIAEYIVRVIGAFAQHFSITNANSYQYLRNYKGLDFLTRHYDVEHTLSIEDAVEDCAIVCHRHGGALTFIQPTFQYFFGTEQALLTLKKMEI